MLKEIWLFLDSSKPGGIETHVLQLANGLRHFGYQPRVVFLKSYGKHPLLEQLHAEGIPTIVLDGRFRSLLKTLCHSQPMILHTHGYKAGILGRIAARISGVRSFSTYHSGEVGPGLLKLYDWLDCHTAWLAERAFSVSHQIAERIPVSTEVLDNFIDTHDLQASHGQQIAFVGRLSHEKGADRFVELAARLPQQTFHVYGDGPMLAELQTAAGDNVQFHGQQNDMSAVWDNIGLLIMPSRHEGLPMAALEAMGRSIPLLATPVGALPELLDNGNDGWLIDGSDLDAMQRQVNTWLTMNTNEKEQLGAAANAKVQSRYSTQTALTPLLAAYKL